MALDIDLRSSLGVGFGRWFVVALSSSFVKLLQHTSLLGVTEVLQCNLQAFYKAKSWMHMHVSER